MSDKKVDCPDCRGTGRYIGLNAVESCGTCGGSGAFGPSVLSELWPSLNQKLTVEAGVAPAPDKEFHPPDGVGSGPKDVVADLCDSKSPDGQKCMLERGHTGLCCSHRPIVFTWPPEKIDWVSKMMGLPSDIYAGKPDPDKIDLTKFTDRSRKVLQLAKQEADRLNSRHIGSAHLLMALVKEGSGVAAHALDNIGIDIRAIRKEAERLLSPDPRAAICERTPYTDLVRHVFKLAWVEAQSLSHACIGTEHILLGLLRADGGVAKKILSDLGVTSDTVREEVGNLLGHWASPKALPNASGGYNSLKEVFADPGCGFSNGWSPKPTDEAVREVGIRMLEALGVAVTDGPIESSPHWERARRILRENLGIDFSLLPDNRVERIGWAVLHNYAWMKKESFADVSHFIVYLAQDKSVKQVESAKKGSASASAKSWS